MTSNERLAESLRNFVLFGDLPQLQQMLTGLLVAFAEQSLHDELLRLGSLDGRWYMNPVVDEDPCQCD
jgi:hypothetical protein